MCSNTCLRQSKRKNSIVHIYTFSRFHLFDKSSNVFEKISIVKYDGSPSNLIEKKTVRKTYLTLLNKKITFSHLQLILSPRIQLMTLQTRCNARVLIAQFKFSSNPAYEEHELQHTPSVREC